MVADYSDLCCLCGIGCQSLNWCYKHEACEQPSNGAFILDVTVGVACATGSKWGSPPRQPQGAEWNVG